MITITHVPGWGFRRNSSDRRSGRFRNYTLSQSTFKWSGSTSCNSAVVLDLSGCPCVHFDGLVIANPVAHFVAAVSALDLSFTPGIITNGVDQCFTLSSVATGIKLHIGSAATKILGGTECVRWIETGRKTTCVDVVATLKGPLTVYVTRVLKVRQGWATAATTSAADSETWKYHKLAHTTTIRIIRIFETLGRQRRKGSPMLESSTVTSGLDVTSTSRQVWVCSRSMGVDNRRAVLRRAIGSIATCFGRLDLGGIDISPKEAVEPGGISMGFLLETTQKPKDSFAEVSVVSQCTVDGDRHGSQSED
jgi:hypothetical protein